MKSRTSNPITLEEGLDIAKTESTLLKDDEKKESKYGNSSDIDPYSRNLKLLICFIGLQLSYISWGIIQEQVMTQDYKLGKFKSSAFCVFGNRFLALFFALGIVLYRKIMSPKPRKDAPFYFFAPSALSNSLSSWAQYESLKYVSFPTQVLSKSCKIIPVMLVGIILNKKSYPLKDYLEALLITFGVGMFTFSEKSGSNSLGHEDSFFGISLLVMYLACDSFTSQWQSKVFKMHSIDQYEMMLGNNIWALFLTGLSLLQSGEGLESMVFIMADSTAFLHMFILSVTSALGQLFIFYTIKEFGPVIFTIMMTTRQIFSLFVSCLLFSHPMNIMGWIGSCLVFFVVFQRIMRNSD